MDKFTCYRIIAYAWLLFSIVDLVYAFAHFTHPNWSTVGNDLLVFVLSFELSKYAKKEKAKCQLES